MSDANRAPGDPVEEPQPEGDVLGQAHEGLADAEAAQRDISGPDATEDPSDSGLSDHDAALYQSAMGGAATEEEAPAAPPTVVPAEPASAEPVAATPDDEAATRVHTVEPEVVATEAAVVAAPTPQPIFVQAPEEPQPRGNRAFTGLVALLAALSFAVLYLLAALIVDVIAGARTWDTFASDAIAGATSWWLWTATAVFFLGFWLLGAVINRGRWGYWVVWGLVMGFVGYGAHLVGQLFQAPFWQLTRTEGVELMEAQVAAPLAFVAFIIARELTVWFGAWAAARGRRVTEWNTEARREYERTLEAGPQIVRS